MVPNHQADLVMKIPSTPGAPGPRIAGNISRDPCWAPDRRCANTCTGNPRDHKGSKGVPNGNSPEMIQKKSKMDVLKNDEKWHIFKLSHFQSWNMFKVHQPTLRPQHSGWVSSHWLTLRHAGHTNRTSSDLAWRAEIAQRHHFPPAHSSHGALTPSAGRMNADDWQRAVAKSDE